MSVKTLRKNFSALKEEIRKNTLQKARKALVLRKEYKEGEKEIFSEGAAGGRSTTPRPEELKYLAGGQKAMTPEQEEGHKRVINLTGQFSEIKPYNRKEPYNKTATSGLAQHAGIVNGLLAGDHKKYSTDQLASIAQNAINSTYRFEPLGSGKEQERSSQQRKERTRSKDEQKFQQNASNFWADATSSKNGFSPIYDASDKAKRSQESRDLAGQQVKEVPMTRHGEMINDNNVQARTEAAAVRRAPKSRQEFAEMPEEAKQLFRDHPSLIRGHMLATKLARATNLPHPTHVNSFMNDVSHLAAAHAVIPKNRVDYHYYVDSASYPLPHGEGRAPGTEGFEHEGQKFTWNPIDMSAKQHEIWKQGNDRTKLKNLLSSGGSSADVQSLVNSSPYLQNDLQGETNPSEMLKRIKDSEKQNSDTISRRGKQKDNLSQAIQHLGRAQNIYESDAGGDPMHHVKRAIDSLNNASGNEWKMADDNTRQNVVHDLKSKLEGMNESNAKSQLSGVTNRLHSMVGHINRLGNATHDLQVSHPGLDSQVFRPESYSQQDENGNTVSSTETGQPKEYTRPNQQERLHPIVHGQEIHDPDEVMQTLKNRLNEGVTSGSHPITDELADYLENEVYPHLSGKKTGQRPAHPFKEEYLSQVPLHEIHNYLDNDNKVKLGVTGQKHGLRDAAKILGEKVMDEGLSRMSRRERKQFSQLQNAHAQGNIDAEGSAKLADLQHTMRVRGLHYLPESDQMTLKGLRFVAANRHRGLAERGNDLSERVLAALGNSSTNADKMDIAKRASKELGDYKMNNYETPTVAKDPSGRHKLEYKIKRDQHVPQNKGINRILRAMVKQHKDIEDLSGKPERKLASMKKKYPEEAPVREGKIQALKERIKAGQYKPDYQKVEDKMLGRSMSKSGMKRLRKALSVLKNKNQENDPNDPLVPGGPKSYPEMARPRPKTLQAGPDAHKKELNYKDMEQEYIDQKNKVPNWKKKMR